MPYRGRGIFRKSCGKYDLVFSLHLTADVQICTVPLRPNFSTAFCIWRSDRPCNSFTSKCRRTSSADERYAASMVCGRKRKSPLRTSTVITIKREIRMRNNAENVKNTRGKNDRKGERGKEKDQERRKTILRLLSFISFLDSFQNVARISADWHVCHRALLGLAANLQRASAKMRR